MINVKVSMWTETEILYAMFILKAKHEDYEWMLFYDTDHLVSLINHAYADLFSDRAECEEEYLKMEQFEATIVRSVFPKKGRWGNERG